MGRYAIGVDSGTQSTKTVLLDAATGKILLRQTAAHRMIPSAIAGCKEQDPADWIWAAEATLERIVESLGDRRKEVVAIGISGQQHGFVALDAQGHVIRRAKLWCDTTTHDQCRTLIERLGGMTRTIELLGNNILPGYTASKILWLKEQEPENYARLATVLLPHDYLAYWLTGRLVMEYGDASGTALLDVRRRHWCHEVVEAIDPSLMEKLPPLIPSTEPTGHLRPELARRWGLGEEVIVTGSGDNMMAAIGTGNVRPGIVTASLGTSGTIYGCSDRPIIDPKGEVAAFCDAAGRWLPLVCTMNVTVATEMVRRRFQLDHQQFAQLAASVPAGADGLVLVPFFEGERTPNCPDGTGVLLGIREATCDPAHVARAALEGATLGMNYGLRRLQQLGLSTTEIRLTGGGARSPLWRQIVADVFARPVVCPENEEGAAYGAALHAFWVSERDRGATVTIDEVVDRYVTLDEKTRTFPDPSAVRIYEQLQPIFEAVAFDLSSVFSRHRAFLLNVTDAK